MIEKITRTDEEWRALLTPEQYKITRQHGTERAFTGPHLDVKEPGIFQCVGCGLDLFSTKTKYESGSGWPSFYEPISEEVVETKEDRSFFMKRTEVLCARCDSHLGHVFPDGPPPTGLRYCINGHALIFKPAA